MFIGEYDLGGTFFPENQLMPGAEGALVLYSAYIFTMFIVMMNIMVGRKKFLYFIRKFIFLGWFSCC
jgi:hypothetical protein